MTSTTDSAEHPDVSEISDLTEGLLSPTRTSEVRRHLEECDLCADVHASLEEIRGLLGTLPGPAPMPAEVAGRIDAALAAEALLNASAPEAPASTPVEASRVPTGEDDSARVSRETSTADRPAGHPRVSSTGPGRKGRQRGGRRRTVVLGAVLSAAALGLGSVLWSSLSGGQPDTTAHGEQSTSTDTFSKDRLKKQVADLLAGQQSPRGGSRSPGGFGVESVPSPDATGLLKEDSVTVPECVLESIDGADAALAAKEGTYRGTHALLVVLPDAADPTRVTAYLVDATCVDQSSVKSRVLLKHSYPRP
ncbi:anti-sigma factor family protein [Streptomyces sp. NPDC057877]|uniref:anti-sigma factor family protein n=1 Tax=Streptomyces sp. NPDC057877 TaxID=3346269 RepID=UPI0036BD7F3A